MSASRQLKAGYYTVELTKTVWELPERYQDLRPIGIGAFGSVWLDKKSDIFDRILFLSQTHSSSALDTSFNVRVAIKKLSRPFQSHVHAKRCYRELRLLRHMNHENVSYLDLYQQDIISKIWLERAGLYYV